MLIDILRGRNVTCYYDVPDHCVRLEYGWYYEDEDEAELFGDHIAEGLPSGFIFDGIVDYSSSNQENLQIGPVDCVDVRDGRCSLKLSDTDLGTFAEVSFSFSSVCELKSRKKSTDA